MLRTSTDQVAELHRIAELDEAGAADLRAGAPSRRAALAAAGLGAAGVTAAGALALHARLTGDDAGAARRSGAPAAGTPRGDAPAAGSPSAAAVGTLDPVTGLPLPGKASVPAASAAPVPVPARLTTELAATRVTYGATPALRREIAAAGVGAWLGHQLAPRTIPDPLGDAVAALYPTLRRSPASLAAEFRANYRSKTDPVLDLQAAHVGRAIWSSRQLFEMMVGFWSDHFTVPAGAEGNREARADYDRTVIRVHALGRFEDLLVAVAGHPAMLRYLNLSGSTGPNPNENFARELLELHTVGVDGGYTERDIKQAAKLLTGLKVDDETYAVRYSPADHYVGRVKVMGFTAANSSAGGGRNGARALYKYLAHHPRTAQRLATRLARHFVSDDPPAALVTRLATTYARYDTAIAPVLRALFTSPEFAATGGDKLRRPLEHLVAVARALGLTPPQDPQTLRHTAWQLSRSGHMPFAWTTPDGYPDTAASWQSAGQALAQFDVTNSLVHGWWPKGFGYGGPERLLASPASATSPQGVANQLAQRFFGRRPTANESRAVATVLSGPLLTRPYSPGWARGEATATAAVLLLHSPAFLTR